MAQNTEPVQQSDFRQAFLLCLELEGQSGFVTVLSLAAFEMVLLEGINCAVAPMGGCGLACGSCAVGYCDPLRLMLPLRHTEYPSRKLCCQQVFKTVPASGCRSTWPVVGPAGQGFLCIVHDQLMDSGTPDLTERNV